MDLFDRLFGDVDKIHVHAFKAAIIDYIAGYTTRAQIITAWSLDTEATTDLDVLLTAVDALSTLVEKLRLAAELDAVMILAEDGLKYTTKSAFRTRLGL